jgi:hypothetical protein
MKIATAIDRTLRVFAALAAILAVPGVFLIGIMANDAGTSTGVIGSLIILGLGGSLVCWILLCSFRPAVAAEWLGSSEVLRVLLVQLPTYAAGAAALFGCMYFLHVRHHNKTLAQSTDALRPTDASYPTVNPTPIRHLELRGTLPVSIPIGDFEATYATDNSTSELVAGPCQRLIDVGPKSLWYTLPLRVKESVPITRDDDQYYHATLTADRFLRGRCGWHLQELHFRSESPAYTARTNKIEGGDGPIQVRDEQQLIAEIAAGKSIYRGRMDLWCFRSLGIRQPPELCGDLETIGRYIPWSKRRSIPKEQAHSNSIVYVTPDSQTIEFNFHDAEAADSSL